MVTCTAGETPVYEQLAKSVGNSVSRNSTTLCPFLAVPSIIRYRGLVTITGTDYANTWLGVFMWSI